MNELVQAVRKSLDRKDIGIFKRWLETTKRPVTEDLRKVLYQFSTLFSDNDTAIDLMDMMLDLAIKRDCETFHNQFAQEQLT